MCAVLQHKLLFSLYIRRETHCSSPP
jgi:hypothetical protein